MGFLCNWNDIRTLLSIENGRGDFMEPRKNSISIISLITSALGLFLMMSASSFNTSLVNLATLLTFVGLACALVSIFHPDYKKLCGVTGIMLCLISFIVKQI